MSRESPSFTPETTNKVVAEQELSEKPERSLLNRLAEKFKRQKALTVAFGLSAILHGGALGATKGKEIVEFFSDQYTTVERKMRRIKFIPDAGVLAGFPDAGLAEPLKEKYKEKEKIDFGEFFLDAEYAKGGISKEEIMTAGNDIKQLRQKYREMDVKIKDPERKLRVIHEILQEKGDYKIDSSFLSDLLNKKKCADKNKRCGNCEARLKYSLSVIQGVYPDTQFKMQILRGSSIADDLHVVLLANIDGEWYSLEDTPKKINDSDLDGSVVTGVDVFIRNYLGDKVEGRMVAEKESKGNTPQPKIKVKTNTFFNLLPPGMMPTKVYSNQPSPSYAAAGAKISFEAAQENIKREMVKEEEDLKVHIIDEAEWEKSQKERIKDKSKEVKEKTQELVFKPSPKNVLNAKLTGEFQTTQWDFQTKEFTEWNAARINVVDYLHKHLRDSFKSGSFNKTKSVIISIRDLFDILINTDLSKKLSFDKDAYRIFDLIDKMEKEDVGERYMDLAQEIARIMGNWTDMISVGDRYSTRPSKTDLQPLRDVPLNKLEVVNEYTTFDLADLGTGIKTIQDIILRGKIKNLGLLNMAPDELRLVSVELKYYYNGQDANYSLENFDFLRGKKIKKLHVSAKKIGNLNALKQMNIEELHLTTFDDDGIEDIDVVPTLSLKELHLSFYGHVTSVERLRNIKADTVVLFIYSFPDILDLSPLKELIDSRRIKFILPGYEIDYKNYTVRHR
jgi:hypothetical protein